MQEYINIDNQKLLNIKGVEKIISSTPNQSIIQSNLSYIQIHGNNLEVKKLDVENKEAIIEGDIYNIKFNKQAEKKSLWKRLFR